MTDTKYEPEVIGKWVDEHGVVVAPIVVDDSPCDVNKDRPDYVVCIAETRAGRVGKSLCGRAVGFERNAEFFCYGFAFLSIDHWFHNAQNGGRLVGCPQCVAKIAEKIDSELEELRAEP